MIFFKRAKMKILSMNVLNVFVISGLILSSSFMFACKTNQITNLDLEDKEVSLNFGPENFNWIEYLIQEGDTISSIASRFNVSTSTIIHLNDTLHIKTGETIKIPNIDGICYTVKINDTISRIAVNYHIPPQVIIDVNGIENDAVSEGEVLFLPGIETVSEADLSAQEKMFIFPIGERLMTGSFGWRLDPITEKYRFHTGIDIRAGIGTPVKAAGEGIVTETGGDRMYGKYIIIEHENSYHTFYAHLSAVSVKQGDRVENGNIIGETGNTGYSTGPHLHFSIFRNGKVVNPAHFLNWD